MRYNVTCTLIYNGNYVVEASSEEEAIEKAREAFNRKSSFQQAPSELCVGEVDFTFGECTADYAGPDN